MRSVAFQGPTHSLQGEVEAEGVCSERVMLERLNKGESNTNAKA